MWPTTPSWRRHPGRGLDDRIDEVRAVVRAAVAAKLAVANPGYFDRGAVGEGER